MTRSKKGGLESRRKSALKLLESQYEKFKAAGIDKPTRTKKVWVVNHVEEVQKPSRSYAAECQRMKNEIDKLKNPRKKKDIE